MNSNRRIFHTNRPLIGMIHFPPLVGYRDFPGLDYILKKSINEAKLLQAGGVDAIMLENNYDIPHVEFVPKEASSMMTFLTQKVCETVSLPIGISTLWNDYKTSLSICSQTRASFIRIPAFVDTVITSYGLMTAAAKKAVTLRQKLGLHRVAILADVQVKHSEMVDKNKSLSQSVREAIDSGADAIIVTGKWTGDSPKIDDLKEAREAAGSFPIFIGSGANINNLKSLLNFADGIIVGTAVKEGESLSKEKETNLKPFEYSIDSQKTKDFSVTFDLLVHPIA